MKPMPSKRTRVPQLPPNTSGQNISYNPNGTKNSAVNKATFLSPQFPDEGQEGNIEKEGKKEGVSSFLLNCEAFEQCYNGCSKDITTYVTLMDCLINTHRDVEYLCDRNIIENHFGTDGEVAHFFNSAGKEVAFDIDMCYLSQLFNDVHQYYRSGWHVQWASFKYTYFDTPWSFISALAAFILLLLTVAQTYLSAVQAYQLS